MTTTQARTLRAARAATQRVAAYARESQDKAGDAHNVADQLVEISAACAARGWDLRPALTFTDNDLDATSGKPRPAFEAMRALVDARQVDVIVVRHMDRLVRRVAELEAVIARCERAGAGIVTLAGELDLASPSGRLVGRLLASVAQHEVELKAERQVMAAQQAAQRGEARRSTPRPFGWEDDRITRRPAEAAAIEWAATYLTRGGTVAGVGREWQDRGLRPAQVPLPARKLRAGEPRAVAGPLPRRAWTSTSVVTIMTSPRIAGYVARLPEADRRALRAAGKPRPLHAPVVTDDDGTPVRGQWQRILDPELWEAVVRVLANPGRTVTRSDGRVVTGRKGRSGVRSLLGGLAHCRCGNVVHANHRAAQGYSQYRCQPPTRTEEHPGPHATQRADRVDDYVTRVMLARLARPDLADLLAPARPDLGPLRIEQKNKRAALVRLGEDYDNDLITREEWLARRGKLTARLAEIGTVLAEADSGSVLAPFTAGGAAAKVWAGLDNAQRRAVIGALCTVVIHPAGRGRRTFDPATVAIEWHQD